MNFKLGTEFCSCILCTRSNALLRFTVQTAVFLSVNSTIVTCKKYSPACRKSLVFKLNLLPKVYAGYNIVRWKTRTWNVPNLKKTMWENEKETVSDPVPMGWIWFHKHQATPKKSHAQRDCLMKTKVSISIYQSKALSKGWCRPS